LKGDVTRYAANLIYRLLFFAVLSAVLIAALWISEQFRPHSASKPLPEPLQKYLGRTDYPPAAEPDPRTQSGVQMPIEIGR
jgi:hypothetical protein